MIEIYGRECRLFAMQRRTLIKNTLFPIFPIQMLFTLYKRNLY